MQAPNHEARKEEELKKGDVRDSWVNEVKMPLQLFRDRIRKCADEVLSSFRVFEDLEVGVEHFICFAYRHGERKPISSG